MEARKANHILHSLDEVMHVANGVVEPLQAEATRDGAGRRGHRVIAGEEGTGETVRGEKTQADVAVEFDLCDAGAAASVRSGGGGAGCPGGAAERGGGDGAFAASGNGSLRGTGDEGTHDLRCKMRQPCGPCKNGGSHHPLIASAPRSALYAVHSRARLVCHVGVVDSETDCPHGEPVRPNEAKRLLLRCRSTGKAIIERHF